MASDSWQPDSVRQARAVLEADSAVLGLVLTGSLTYPDAETDSWSDVDLTVVVADKAMPRFYPHTDWLSAFGEVYAYALSSNEFFGAVRTYFTDGRRMDFVIVSESSLERIDEWPHNSLAYGAACLFSRSPVLDRVLVRTSHKPTYQPPAPEKVKEMANDFWFKGMLAVSKVARGDLLVALHLSLDLVRDCAVLAMLLRDRREGTNHHRHGGNAAASITQLEQTRQPYTTQGIIGSIERSAILYDTLSRQLSDGYQERRHALLAFIERARDNI